MTERQSGLRFDIYERIQLAEDTSAIKELNEVELVPHIQVYTEQEQAVLRGHLYLTGSYQGEAGEDPRTLEHLIPVEIMLPLNRIQDVAQVSVDIDHFDVDLLNSRSLNVTGVLTLNGIEMLSAPDESWKDEETVFVHEAPPPSIRQETASDSIAETWQQPAWDDDSVRDEVLSPWSAYQTAAVEAWRSEPVQPVPVVQPPAQPVPVSEQLKPSMEEAVQETQNTAWASMMEASPDNITYDVTEEASFNFQPSAEQPIAEVSAQQQEEKKELKIAFVSQQPAADTSYHLQSLIHTKEYRAPEPDLEEEELPTPRTDALEWKRLFSRTVEEGDQFRTVRVCIVQKEETLEEIAERYQVNPKEIQLYNRLADAEVAEGKALFIPR